MISYAMLQPDEAAMMFNEGYEVEAKDRFKMDSPWTFVDFKHPLNSNYVYRIVIED